MRHIHSQCIPVTIVTLALHSVILPIDTVDVLSPTDGYDCRSHQISKSLGTTFKATLMVGAYGVIEYDGKQMSANAELSIPSVHISSFCEGTKGELYLCNYIVGKMLKIVGPD